MPNDVKRGLVFQDNHLSLSRQCQLIGLSRQSLYYESVILTQEEKDLLNQIDQIYTDYPFFGTRRIVDELKGFGHCIGCDRVRTLMRHLGIEAIYPKRNLSKPAPGHKVFPYLLRGKIIDSPNQVWSADITYVRLLDGFIYLFAIIDWYSRYVLSWRVSPTLSVEFCVEALLEALEIATPKIFNVDQGSQFTSPLFYDHILIRDILYSMDGRGRYLDNIFVERLWRTVKYENIFISGYSNINETEVGLEEYFFFYNNLRRHMSLQRCTPFFIYTTTH